MSSLSGFAYLAQHPFVSFLGLFVLLTVVVFFHELGHFLVGRWCGVKVDAFSIGFGPEVFAFVDKKGTRWRFAALPLGGYVKFHGDQNAASMPDVDALNNMPVAEQKITLASKTVWQRMAIVAAGPAANFILAIVIYTGLVYSYGHQYTLPKVAAVVAGGPADRAGLKPGDLLLSIEGRTIESFADLQRVVSTNAETPLVVELVRGGVQTQATLIPETKEQLNILGIKQSVGIVGIQGSEAAEDQRSQKMSILSSARMATGMVWQQVEVTGNYVRRLVTGRDSVDKVSGLLRTAEVAGKVVEMGIGMLLQIIAGISISIGLMNLLPIPVLDGGHLMYFAFEAIRGKPLSERVQEYGFRFGLAAIIALVVMVNMHDVLRMAGG